MPIFPEFYRNKFNAAKNFVANIWPENGHFFGQDLNEMQAQLQHQMRANADALFRDGDVTEGGSVLIDGQSGAVILESGKVYLQGVVRELAHAALQVPITGEHSIGVVLETQVMTALQDPDLIFDDQRFATHGQPLAQRLRERARWGTSNEVLTDTPVVSYRYFPVYRVLNGVVVDNSPPPQVSGFNAELARYDREANGNYVARGFRVTHVSGPAGGKAFSVEEGVANVRGFKVDRASAVRLVYEDDPDLETIRAEPHFFNDAGSGSMIFTLNRTPIDAVLDVSVLTQTSRNILRGQTSGGRDPLPNAQVAGIVAIVQGATTYAAGTDFTLVGDEVDWSPTGGREPSPGSTYQVTYRYKKSIQPDAVTDSTVTVSGAVTGSEVDIDYRWKMPRIDILALDRNGSFKRIKGVSTPYNPAPPAVPEDLLALATISNSFGADAPVVRNIAPRAVPFSEIEDMKGLIVQSFDELARLRLAQDAIASDPAAKNGIFVDNFVDDDLRDQGVQQTAAIVRGELTLPIAVQVLDGALSSNAWSLEYRPEVFISQPRHTGQMKVNPYQAFDPLPAILRLEPAVDQWTETQTQWQSAVTRALTQGSGDQASTSVETTIETLRAETFAAATLRQRQVAFTITGFDPNERLARLSFDGIDVTPDPAPVANAQGGLSGAFQVPANVPAGAKSVEALGAAGSFGAADYVGRGIVTLQELRRVTTSTTTLFWGGRDPLAWTFNPSRGFHCAGIRIKVTEIGNRASPIVVQLRGTLVGQPTQEILADAVIDMTSVTAGQWLEVLFDLPPWCEASIERAFVFLSDDPHHALAIAQIGKYDPQTGWVTSQAGAGVLLSSPNASTWTAHPDMDLTAQILEARYTQATRTVQLGSIAGSRLTDLIALAGVETPAPGTDIELVFSRQDGSEIRTAPNSVVSLTEELDGPLQVKAILKGTAGASPILFPNVQLILGSLTEEADYVSRSFRCGTGATLLVRFEARLPGNAAVTVEVRKEDGSWLAVARQAQDAVGDGWFEHTYRLENVTASVTAVRLRLEGSALNRPRLRRLKALSLSV